VSFCTISPTDESTTKQLDIHRPPKTALVDNTNWSDGHLERRRYRDTERLFNGIPVLQAGVDRAPLRRILGQAEVVLVVNVRIAPVEYFKREPARRQAWCAVELGQHAFLHEPAHREGGPEGGGLQCPARPQSRFFVRGKGRLHGMHARYVVLKRGRRRVAQRGRNQGRGLSGCRVHPGRSRMRRDLDMG
jgi:hypothetical protein